MTSLRPITAPSVRSGPVRAIVTAIGVALLVLAAPLTASARGVQADPTTTTTAPVDPNAPDASGVKGGEAISDLADCIQGSKHLAVVFLIDQSGSLGKSDPDNTRVDAAKAALDSLVSLTQGTKEEQAQVDATFGAFSNTYYPVRPWTVVNARTQPAMERTIEAFKKRNQGTDTDFVTALTGARKALADHSAEVTATGQPEPCKAIVLFTDGQYDIGVRDPSNVDRLGSTKPYAPGADLNTSKGAALAELAGRSELCKEGGLADGLRDDDITLLSIALTGTVTAKEQDFLTAASTGQSNGLTCGRPTDRAPGAYVAANNVGALVARFDEIATRVAGGTVVKGAGAPLVLCGDDDCPGGTRRIQIDRSVRRLRLLAIAPKPGMSVEIISPTGSDTITAAGSSTVGAAPVRARAIAGRGFGIDIDRPTSPAGSAAWQGTWKVVLHDTSGTQVGQRVTFAHYLFTDVGIQFAKGKLPVLTRGKKAAVAATLVIPKGSDTKLRKASVVLRLDDRLNSKSTSFPLVGSPNGPFAGTVEVPASYQSNSYDATLELHGATTTGAVVEARSSPQSIVVQRPDGAIQFAPAALVMPTLEGTGATPADLIVFGGTKDGCVWFGPSQTRTAPQEAGDLTVSYDGKNTVDEKSCISVPAEATVYVTVEVSPAHRATGAVRGQIEVHEKTDGAKATVTDIGYQLDMAAGIDQARRLLLAVGLLLGGLLLPLLLLIVINSITARFQDLTAVQGAVVPIRLEGDRIWRNDRGRWSGFFLQDSDFQSLAEAGDARRFTFGGIIFRARPSRNPFGASLAMAAPEGGAERLKGGVGSRVELDLGLSGSWLFMLDPDRTRAQNRDNVAEGTLIAFIAQGEVAPQIARMNPDIDRRLPSIAAGLASIVRLATPKPAKAAKPAKGTKAARSQGAIEDEPGSEPAATGVSEGGQSRAHPADGTDRSGADLATPAGVAENEGGPEAAPAMDGQPDDEPPPAPLGFTGGPGAT